MLKFWQISFKRWKHALFKAAAVSALGCKDKEDICWGRHLNGFIKLPSLAFSSLDGKHCKKSFLNYLCILRKQKFFSPLLKAERKGSSIFEGPVIGNWKRKGMKTVGSLRLFETEIHIGRKRGIPSKVKEGWNGDLEGHKWEPEMNWNTPQAECETQWHQLQPAPSVTRSQADFACWGWHFLAELQRLKPNF